MAIDNLWFVSEKKEDCPKCNSIESVRIEYFHAIRTPIDPDNEFIHKNQVRKKTKKICNICNDINENWEEWVERIFPKKSDSEFLKRRALYFKDHYSAMAEEGFRDLFKIRPSDSEMLYEYGKILYSKDNLYLAYNVFQKSEKKKFLPAIIAKADLLYDLFISKNEFWFEKRKYFGKYTRLFSNFNDLVRELNNTLKFLIEHNQNKKEIQTGYYLKAGNVLEEYWDYSLAIQYYEYVYNQSIHIAERAESLIRLAVIFANKQDYKIAFQYLDKSNSLVPNLLIQLYSIKFYFKNSEKEKANSELESFLNSLEKLIQKNPNDPRLYYFKGLALEYTETPKNLIEYYNSVLDKIKMDLSIRKNFYTKINSLEASYTEQIVILNEKESCPICKFRKINIIRYSERVAELDNWADGINSTVFYIQSIQYRCMNCNLEWWKYRNWEEREFEYPG